MKCPLRKEELITRPDLTQYSIQECLKEKCQWYNATIKACAVFLIPRELNELNETLTKVAKELTMLRPSRK